MEGAEQSEFKNIEMIRHIVARLCRSAEPRRSVGAERWRPLRDPRALRTSRDNQDPTQIDSYGQARGSRGITEKDQKVKKGPRNSAPGAFT